MSAVVDGLEGFLNLQSNRVVSIHHAQTATEFIFTRRRRGRDLAHRVVVTEAFWADARYRPGALKSAGWLLRLFPVLLCLLFSPDARDLDPHRSSVLRIIYRLALPAFLLLSLAQPGVWWIPITLGILTAASLVVRRWNIVGDVIMAVGDASAVAEVTGVVNRNIDEALAVARRVIVVGHSKGGYLSHQALLQEGLSGRRND